MLYGVEDCLVLEYDAEQQVTGNHLLTTWETVDKRNGPNARQLV